MVEWPDRSFFSVKIHEEQLGIFKKVHKNLSDLDQEDYLPQCFLTLLLEDTPTSHIFKLAILDTGHSIRKPEHRKIQR